jgi:hypothetical protein
MKAAFALLAILCTACLCDARPVRAWSYQDLVKESDLVVIATPVTTQDLKGEVEVPNMSQVDNDGKRSPVMAVGVETKFQVEVIFKGEKQDLKEFVVYHLRQPDKSVAIPNGPMFAVFNLKIPVPKYLLFLKREADGRYVSVTGQADSSMGVKELGAFP